MKTKLTDDQKIAVDDLLKEKDLWAIYKSSWKIRFSRFNIVAGVLTSIVIGAFAFWLNKPSLVVDHLQVFSAVAFSMCLSQLGFLLAGFSFFATVADKEMFCRMAERVHSPSGLSYLKYNFFVFMRVFCEFLVFGVICLVLMVALAEGVGIRELGALLLKNCSDLKRILAGASLGLVVGATVYLVLQLAAFIFNIFHVVMTSIRWALEIDYDAQNESSLNPYVLPSESWQENAN